jgi:Protein of unknown function (DUF3224)
MRLHALCAAAAISGIAAGSVGAETLRSNTVFNTGSQAMAAEQPSDGLAVRYPVAYSGALDGCTAEIAETLYPREEGAWGIYEVAGNVTCGDGGFAFSSTGSWDGKGFHGAGRVTEGSGTGRFAGLSGRIAQSGGAKPAPDGTDDISYEMLIDAAAP